MERGRGLGRAVAVETAAGHGQGQLQEWLSSLEGTLTMETCVCSGPKTPRGVSARLTNNENLLNLYSLRETFLVSLIYKINTATY